MRELCIYIADAATKKTGVHFNAEDFEWREQSMGAATIIYRGELPAPFHRGVLLEQVFSTKAEDLEKIGARAGQAVLKIRNDIDLLTERMREAIDRVEVTIAGTGVRLLKWMPYSYFSYGSDHNTLMIAGKFAFLNESLELVERYVQFGTNGRHNDVDQIARAQRRRIKRAGLDIHVDEIVARVLRQMPETALRRLADFLVKHPGVAIGNIHIRPWTAIDLKKEGIFVPEAIETICIRDGIVRAKVRLSPTTTWNKKLIHRKAQLPQTVINALSGRQVGDFVSHPFLRANIVIEAAKIRATGDIDLKLDVKMIRFPFDVAIME